jgi:hypothetical protein
MLLKKNYWIQKNKLQCPKDWLRPSLQSNAFKKKLLDSKKQTSMSEGLASPILAKQCF